MNLFIKIGICLGTLCLPACMQQEQPAPDGTTCALGSLPAYAGNGSITWYTLDQGSNGQVHCSFPVLGQNPDVIAHVATGAGQYFAAMNTADYRNAAACGGCVEVTNDATGKSVVATVVDECPTATNPKCTRGHIDLSKAAFEVIADPVSGYVGTGNGGCCGSISWRYVGCPTTENVTFLLKEPTNVWWDQILVQGSRYPITKVLVNGAATTRQPYNYWGDLGAGPYDVVVTDANGSVIEASVQKSAGDLTSAVQFPDLCQ